jgi:asparagine synthase (glutamine-hydrolysing)
MSFYFIMKLAAQSGLKVMLDGMGADSYLAGSSLCFERLIGGYLRKMRIVRAFEALYHCAPPRSDGRRDLFRRSMRTVLRGERELVVGGSLHERSSLGFDGDLAFEPREARGSRLKRYLYYLIFSNLDPVLHNLDRMSMASAIEVRVPFLDHRLVEFTYSLQDEDLLSLGQTKYILRASLEGFLPKAIAARVDKQGLLGREIVVWLRGPLRHLIESTIDFDRLPFLNRDKTEALIAEFKSGSNAQVHLLWRLVSLNYWLKLNDRLPQGAVVGI